MEICRVPPTQIVAPWAVTPRTSDCHGATYTCRPARFATATLRFLDQKLAAPQARPRSSDEQGREHNGLWLDAPPTVPARGMMALFIRSARPFTFRRLAHTACKVGERGSRSVCAGGLRSKGSERDPAPDYRSRSQRHRLEWHGDRRIRAGSAGSGRLRHVRSLCRYRTGGGQCYRVLPTFNLVVIADPADVAADYEFATRLQVRLTSIVCEPSFRRIGRYSQAPRS